MIELTARKWRRAWFCIGELPWQSVTEVHLLRETLPATDPADLLERRAAVEVFIPLGARFHYGLLGAHFEPANSGLLVVEVATSDHSTKGYCASMPMAWFREGSTPAEPMLSAPGGYRLTVRRSEWLAPRPLLFKG